ncbi:MAG: aminotransferase class I/II-fold pyridoxal phosphate-dependent enzyme [Candidatus Rokubacteria bacterium]|nr:aminotransferase class I/II-fold pyridoxal phosphate-dependent enzyme [Candidatus Rokubacteria bacterium]
MSASTPEPYIPDTGMTVVKKVAVPPGVPPVQLSLNESHLGASPRAVAAAKTRAETLRRYPDPASTALREAIGRRFGLDPDHLVCGNGSEELLDVIGRAYARPGDEILFTEHGFIQFPIVAMRVGATPARAPERDRVADVDALLAHVTPRTRVVFLANPNNPTGTTLGVEALRHLRDRLPGHVVLVLDSAYAEYATQPDYTAGHELVAGTDNVVVTRTFSKAYGLAALRVGWAHCPPSMARVLNRLRGIGNVNALAQEAALVALDEPGWVERVRDEVARMRDRLTREYRALGREPLPSQTNFVTVRFPPAARRTAADAHAFLAGRGVVVRRVDDHGLGDFLRVTIGSDEDNQRLLDGLRAFLDHAR